MNRRSGGSPIRVLLVHANPYQRVEPVPAYGLERLRTASLDLGADIRILDPYLISDRPIDTAIEVARQFQPQVVGLGIRIVDDCITIDTSDETEQQFDVSWFMPEIQRLRRAVGAALPEASFILGGAGFSAMPKECLEYVDVDHGVVGAGEKPFREFLVRVAARAPLTNIPGVVHRNDADPLSGYNLTIEGGITARETLYAPTNSFPVRTRIGCGMQCSYCVTANLQRKRSRDEVGAVVDELEAVLDKSRDRGISKVPIFFADDEFNLTDERHPIAILKGVLNRGLEKRMRWTAYFNPTPFSDELAELVRATNGKPDFAVDTASPEMIVRTQKPFRRPHLDALMKRLQKHQLEAGVGLIFGLPGETDETIDETVEFARHLPPGVGAVYSSGARVYPHTPLATKAMADPKNVYGASGEGYFPPVVYSRPFPPRELARRLEVAFADAPHVRRLGVAYRRARPTVANAYRAVLSGADKQEWDQVLSAAEEPGDPARAPSESLAAVVQVALWHGRWDLAAIAVRRLRKRPDLPSGISRMRLRFGASMYGAMGRIERLRRGNRSRG